MKPLRGKPAYMTGEDEVEFVLGVGKDLPGESVFRAIPQDDQWDIANCVYASGAPMVVTDFRGKGQPRMWRVDPTEDPERGVILTPLHDDGTFFRGRKAFAADPLVLTSGLKVVLEHIDSETSFNKMSVAAATKKGWNDLSKWIALFLSYGFIRATGARTWYGMDSEAVLSLKSYKDRVQAQGNRMNYEKTELWQSLMGQFHAMIASKAKGVEASVGLPLVAADQEAGSPDADLVAGDDTAGGGAVAVDEGPVDAPEVDEE